METAPFSGIPNFLLINPRLATSGQPAPEQFTSIAAAGFQVVINLAMPTSENFLPNEQQIVEALGMQFHHLPVIWEKPSEELFAEFCALMRRYADQKVYVHCALNMRVSAFVFLYRVRELRVPEDVAKRDLLKIWEPEGIWRQFVEARLPNRENG